CSSTSSMASVPRSPASSTSISTCASSASWRSRCITTDQFESRENMAEALAASEGKPEKLKVDKFADGSITLLKFAGTIDEEFSGKKLAGTLKSGTYVLDLNDIQKISSFGIREWVDFVNQLSGKAEAVYFIECAPKVV